MSKQPECIECGNYISHGNAICQDCLSQHDAAIARKAREDVLKIIKATDEGACPYDHCIGDGKNCRDCLISWIEESLQQHSEHEQGGSSGCK